MVAGVRRLIHALDRFLFTDFLAFVVSLPEGREALFVAAGVLSAFGISSRHTYLELRCHGNVQHLVVGLGARFLVVRRNDDGKAASCIPIGPSAFRPRTIGDQRAPAIIRVDKGAAGPRPPVLTDDFRARNIVVVEATRFIGCLCDTNP